MTYSEQCKLQNEYYDWLKKKSEEFKEPVESWSTFTTILIFLSEKGLLKEE